MSLKSDLEEQIILYLYGELDDSQTRRFEQELQRDPALRRRLSEMRNLHGLLNSRTSLKPPDDLLERARTRLGYRLRDEQRKAVRESWFDSLTFLMTRHLRIVIPAGALALLLVGVLIGRFAWPQRWNAVSSVEQGSYFGVTAGSESYITGVDFIRYEPNTGRVTIRYKALTDEAVQGNVSDPGVRRLLAYAIAADPHPGRRLTAVKAVSEQRISDPRVEGALILAMKQDSVAGVRLKAAKVLQTFPLSERTKQAFTEVLLHEPNSAIRIEALNALSRLSEESELRSVFENAVRRDSNDFIRLKAARALERTENPVSPDGKK